MPVLAQCKYALVYDSPPFFPLHSHLPFPLRPFPLSTICLLFVFRKRPSAVDLAMTNDPQSPHACCKVGLDVCVEGES